jgi:predicted adenylyl cyclase CyaB
MAHLNVEIKARCPDATHIRDVLQAHRAVFKGLDHQVDTYFRTPAGRLKLREGIIENHLIYYERPDQQGPKCSKVMLYDTSRDAAPLKEILRKAYGVLVAVDKQREIYFVDNVKFHIDTVEGLGRFTEIEAIDKDGTIGQARLDEQCRHFCEQFRIKPEDYISCSYSDLLLAPAKK